MPRHILGLLVLCWCFFLAVQGGDRFDETEHAHVAWLIGAQGQQPIRDFFQHHQPLLWDVLALYYRLGGTGPEVLYFGRALVVACALLLALSLMAISRRQGGSGGLALVAGVVLTCAFPTLFVIRPETLGLTAFVLAVLFWLCGRGLAGNFLAGLFFGAAAFASPRFLPLAGAFLVLEKDGTRLFFLRPASLAAWSLGAVSFVGGYLLLTGYSSDALLFNVICSGTLTRIGPGSLAEVPLMLATAGACAVLGRFLYPHLQATARQRFLLLTLYGLLVLAAALASAWPYLHSQALAAPVAWLLILLAVAEPRIDWHGWSGRVQLQRAAWAVGAACVLLAGLSLIRGTSIVARVGDKHRLLRTLRPDDRVLLAAATHPICVRDVSYYANPLTDGEDRLPQALRRLRARWPQLPDCDYLREVNQEQPTLLDGYLFLALPGSSGDTLWQILNRDYEPVYPEDTSGSRDRALFRRRTTWATSADSARHVLRP